MTVLPSRPTTPRGRRTRIAVAAALTLLAAGCGGQDDGRDAAADDPTPAAATPTTPAASAPSRVADPGDLPDLISEIPADDASVARVGTPSTTVDGDPVALTRAGGGFRLTITIDGEPLAARLPGGDSPVVFRQPVALGQAGEGFLVVQEGGDSTRMRLLVPRDGALVTATEDADVPFGGGFVDDGGTYRTWLSEDGAGLFTAVVAGDDSSVAGPDPDATSQVWRWGVTGPGEGGGADSDVVALVPEEIGTVCFDFEATPATAERC